MQFAVYFAMFFYVGGQAHTKLLVASKSAVEWYKSSAIYLFPSNVFQILQILIMCQLSVRG